MFSKKGLISLYKSQVLSYIEYATPALHHAPHFFLQRLDQVQERFLTELGVTQILATVDFNLCPLATRRNIAMLGLIHRTVLGKGPKQFKQFFRSGSAVALPRMLRSPELRHDKQLYDRMNGTERNALCRYVLSLVYPYNLLPQRVVDLGTVCKFQRALQAAVKTACEQQVLDWPLVLTAGARKLTVHRFQSLF